MTEHKQIDVRPQVKLSLKKSFKFCKKGISYRLFRSTLTLAVVVVAVAFFMVLLSESVLVRSIGQGVRGEVLKLREADMLLARLYQPLSSRALSVRLDQADGKPELVKEFAAVAALSEEKAAALVEKSHLEQTYTRFFENLTVGKRVVLIKKNKWREVFTFLRDKENWKEFSENLDAMRSVRLPTELATLKRFAASHPTFVEELEKARQKWITRIAALRTGLKALTGDRDPDAWLAEASDADVEQWRQTVADAGVLLDKDAMRRIRRLLVIAETQERISTFLRSNENRAKWREVYGASPGIVEKISRLMEEGAGQVLGDAFSVEQRKMVSDAFARSKHYRDLLAKLPLRKPGQAEPKFLDGQQMFLVSISFLVCMVGIANAMLMSITERFREIATMKCLGATDGFILNQFLIEAAIQGTFGGAAGMLIGLVITWVKGVIIYGSSVFTYFPAVPVLFCCVFTVLIGIVLAMLASIYPARAAASMAPMDAMRVE